MKQKIEIKPAFINTKNVRNFSAMMDGLALAEGEGRMGAVFGKAGRGKTRTAQVYAANNDCHYLRVATVWRGTELEFLRGMAKVIGIDSPPHRKGGCFAALVEHLLADPQPVMVDEIEKMPKTYLDIIRDLTDLSTAPFILIGEEDLKGMLQDHGRAWSRTYQKLEFDPIGVGDVMFYATDATGLKLSPEVAGILHKASGGDFRIVRRDMIALVQIINARGTVEITEEMARIATRAGLSGGK